MSESKQGTTPEAAEGSGGNENSPSQESNKNKPNYNTNNKGGKIRKHHNEHESLQYEGSNPKIGGILALRNENFRPFLIVTGLQERIHVFVSVFSKLHPLSGELQNRLKKISVE